MPKKIDWQFFMQYDSVELLNQYFESNSNYQLITNNIYNCSFCTHVNDSHSMRYKIFVCTCNADCLVKIKVLICKDENKKPISYIINTHAVDPETFNETNSQERRGLSDKIKEAIENILEKKIVSALRIFQNILIDSTIKKNHLLCRFKTMSNTDDQSKETQIILKELQIDKTFER